MPNAEPTNFDDEFDEAVAGWRQRHRLREDDAVLLLVELFRIHQRHWDAVRHREFPSFEQFRADITKLGEAARTFQGQTATMLDLLRKEPSAHGAARINRSAAILATIAGLLAGYLVGRVLAVKLGLLPFGPIMPPLDLVCALRNPRCVFVIGSLFLTLIAVWLLIAPRSRKRYVAQLGGLTWKRTQFCRGWLITGDTGSGKTSSGINQLAHQVFQNEPTWGGLCIDEKGVYWETLTAMAEHYGREHDLIHLQIRATDTDPQWMPPNRYNLTGDRSIPFTTYAKFIVDTATSLGQGGDKGFFKSQAQTHISHALELLFELNRPVTLLNTFELLSDRALLEEEMENLEALLETPRRAAVYGHFANRFLNQPEEQSGGVRETIGNYLQYFLTPEIAEVFCCEESTFDFASIDQGKIILTTMPQKFQTERRYVNTFLKLLYYNHALRRFDRARADRAQNNLLILWADEAQRFMTASEDGTSDYNCVDVIREAGATIVAAAQSTTSFVPPLGNDKSKVLTLNLRNRLIFRAADEADAVQAADFLGKKRVVKRSWGFSAGKRNVNYSETEEHKIKPHKLRNLRDHECVLVHCERGFRRVTLPPLEADGKIARWFPWWRKIL